jgi:predicted transcriptional regulator
LPIGSTGGNTRYVAKVMVSFPDDLLAKVDRTARLRGTTRSGLLADAVRRELERRDPEAMRAAVQELEALAARYGWPTSADIEAEKKERDERDMRR